MGKKFFATPEFEALAKEWETKLESEGLGDIEKDVSYSALTSSRCSVGWRYWDATYIEAKALYFQSLEECVSRASFDNEIDKIVMTMRVQGARIKEICEALLAAGKSRYRRTVRLIIRKYEHRWGIRTWKPEELKYDWLKRQRTR